MEEVRHLVSGSAELEREAYRPSAIADVQQRTPFPLRVRVRVALRLLLYHRRRTRRIWVSAFRSFREHIRLQYAKGSELGDLGPASLLNEDGNLAENTRIAPRILYTEKWLSACPWADSVDLEIFLMGFDAAEQWYGPSSTLSDSRREAARLSPLGPAGRHHTPNSSPTVHT